MSDETTYALDVARDLVAAGVPIFVAAPCLQTCTSRHHKAGEGTGGTGYHLPPKWETTTTNGNQVDRWRPGWALCAVMGHVVDLVDVDPRNGGDATMAGLQAAGAWPRSYGLAATPSGGIHSFIAPLRVHSLDGVAAGLDVKSGDGSGAEGGGHGFAFIAPTVKKSKTTGEPAPYRWAVGPDLSGVEADDSGAALAGMVAAKRNGKAPTGAAGDGFNWDDFTREPGPWFDLAATLAQYTRREAVFKLASALRGQGGWRPGNALLHMQTVVWPLIDQNKGGHPFPWEEFEANVRRGFERHPDGSGDEATVDEAAARQATQLARELVEQRVRREAKRILDREERPAARRPEVLTLRERLVRPAPPVTYRIEEWQPVGSRIVLAAQFKAGKTTLTGNAARSLVDGDLWLGQYKVEPITGTLVILDVEMSSRQLDSWLGDQRIRNDNRVIPIPMRGNAAAFDILDPTTRAEWAAELHRLNCGYLVLDCLRPVLDALGLDEQREAGRFLVAFDTLLAEAGVGEAAVVHHMGHAGERSRGDSRIRDWPDVEWRLVRQDDDPSSPRFISAYGRDVDMPESQLAWDPASRHLLLVGGSRGDAAARAALVDVLALLGDTPRLSGRAVEEGMAGAEHAQKAVRAALKLGIRQGSIAAEPGPRRSTLHSQRVSASDLVASASTQSSECVSAYLEDALHSDTDDDSVRHSPGEIVEDIL